jgi:hypothetical protein
MIGGYKQTGEWKLDARYNKQELISWIEAIAAYSNRISVSNKDAEAFLKTTAATFPTKTLIFLDPPYFRQGQACTRTTINPRTTSDLPMFSRGSSVETGSSPTIIIERFGRRIVAVRGLSILSRTAQQDDTRDQK